MKDIYRLRILTLMIYHSFSMPIKKTNIAMVNYNLKLKRLLLITIIILSPYSHENTPDTSYDVKPSSLPPNELWSIQHSWHVMEHSITPETHEVTDKKSLIQLIKNAWQWDKNAMIQYARIQLRTDDSFLDDFCRENSHLILSQYGFRLKRPEIFDMNYSEFILKLADMEYPLSALLVALKYKYSANETWGRYNPLPPENRAKAIHYIRIAMNGGYHIHSALADVIIFPSGTSFYNGARSALHFFQDRIPTLTQQELIESFEAYKVSALHNSQYAQIRISEFYFYGAGIGQNLERAWAWALIAKDNYINFKKNHADKYHSEKDDEGEYNDYNLDMMSKMEKKYLTKAQQERGAALAAEIKASIITDDYYQWESEMDPIPPMP